MGCRSAIYEDPELLPVEGSGEAVPGRHVVRLLSRRAEPDQAAGRSGERRLGRISARTSARSISGSTASSPGRPTTTSFPFQLFHTARPGSLDTSLVSTDNINNPRTMNAVYDLGARLEVGQALGQGDAGGRQSRQQAVQRFRAGQGPLTAFFQPPITVWTPRVLKDGSDSVGALGALNRVYLNIGLFSEEWLLHFNPLVGGKPAIADRDSTVARQNSAYWEATEAQTPDHGAVLPEERPIRTI